MSNYPEAINYAKLYCQKNSNITYEELTDASQRPDLQEKYSLGTSITSAVVIVEANNRDKIVSANDFYAYDNTTYQQYDVTEQKMTNAILDVNLETNRRIPPTLQSINSSPIRSFLRRGRRQPKTRHIR